MRGGTEPARLDSATVPGQYRARVSWCVLGYAIRFYWAPLVIGQGLVYWITLPPPFGPDPVVVS